MADFSEKKSPENYFSDLSGDLPPCKLLFRRAQKNDNAVKFYPRCHIHFCVQKATAINGQ